MEHKLIEVIDSHTGGEPTRVIVNGGPDLGTGPLADRVKRFAAEFDDVRTTAMNEPRGFDAMVGALLVEPHDESAQFGVIFFNNAGYLGMCGHGTIGLVETLRSQDRIGAGVHRIDTPVGPVSAELRMDGRVSVENVVSYRYAASVKVHVEGLGDITGDIAYGGNWFFLVKDAPPAQLELKNEPELRAAALAIRSALADAGHTGADGAFIDHIEFFAGPRDGRNSSRNYVLCPGGAYDRSPCGTGTSAKLSCLAADGKLAAGDVWLQESLIGSVFECSYALADAKADAKADGEVAIVPTIIGSAHISSVATLVCDPLDPFQFGIPE